MPAIQKTKLNNYGLSQRIKVNIKFEHNSVDSLEACRLVTLAQFQCWWTSHLATCTNKPAGQCFQVPDECWPNAAIQAC